MAKACIRPLSEYSLVMLKNVVSVSAIILLLTIVNMLSRIFACYFNYSLFSGRKVTEAMVSLLI